MGTIFLIFCFMFTVLCSPTRESESDADKNRELVKKFDDAIYYGNVTELQSLFDSGARINYDEFHALHSAVSLYSDGKFNEEIFKLLVKNGANLEVEDNVGRTALLKAIYYGNAKAVKILLENGANPNAYSTVFKMSALQEALFSSRSNAEEIIVLLIEHGANVNQADKDGQTLLHKAIYKGYKKTVELLIEKGANVNAVEKYVKTTPLHYIAFVDSSYRGHENWTEDDYLKIAELLINHGADVYAKDLNNKTPLDMVKLQKVRELLESKMH